MILAEPDDPVYRRALTVQEVATALHTSRPTVYKLMADGDLRYFYLGQARRIPVESLDAYVERRMAQVDPQ